MSRRKEVPLTVRSFVIFEDGRTVAKDDIPPDEWAKISKHLAAKFVRGVVEHYKSHPEEFMEMCKDKERYGITILSGNGQQ